MVLSVRDIIGENTRFSELHADIREMVQVGGPNRDGIGSLC